MKTMSPMPVYYNRGCTYCEIIGASGDGLDLLSYLAGRWRHSTQEQWRERIEAGRVLVEGRRATPREALRRGQSVTWSRPPWAEPEVPLHFTLLHEDESLLAVAKPSGLPMMPGGGFLEHTLLALVRRTHPLASPAHRLGRGTSGVALFAKTKEAGRSLARAWRERGVLKVYRALIEGSPSADAFTVETPIGPVAHPGLGTLHAASARGKDSRSEVSVLERREGVSLVEVRIETGRPHQIRIHMAACGHPLAGDPLYGPGGVPRADALPGDLGYLLHATRLALPHPDTGVTFEVGCEPPLELTVGLLQSHQRPSLAGRKPKSPTPWPGSK